MSAQISRVRAARRLAKRSFRATDRRFLAEGPQAVREALRRPDLVVGVYIAAGSEARHAQLIDAAPRGTVHQLGSADMMGLSDTVTPQGIVAVCRFLDIPWQEMIAGTPRLVVVLAQIRDPGNAGTVLRVADAVGADAVVLSTASVDVYNSKCVRASAGSLFHVPVVINVDLPSAISELRNAGLRVMAADGSGDVDLDAELNRGNLRSPTAWIFGNEARGLPEGVRELADATVRIPIHGAAESLNLAAASAICLYSSARAQRAVTEESASTAPVSSP
jgi:RNA methyltransferase, TrmH family